MRISTFLLPIGKQRKRKESSSFNDQERSKRPAGHATTEHDILHSFAAQSGMHESAGDQFNQMMNEKYQINIGKSETKDF